ncbi:AAA family ATPase [Streptomyces sp. NPDC058145]|uniref:AAA family ATPase n=1 Tax=Streptomyces sp. NPDC058145 TaxID=3346356 RepID=UPI0036EF65F6
MARTDQVFLHAFAAPGEKWDGDGYGCAEVGHSDGMDQDALATAVAAFNRASYVQELAEAEEQRQGIFREFPLESWPELPLERYALGFADRQKWGAPFCARMEFHTDALGSIRGGAAGKHIMFLHRSGEWKQSAPLKGMSPEDAWQRLRKEFVEAFAAAQDGAFDRVDDLEVLAYGPALVTKSLATYFPDDFLPVYSSDHLRHFIALLGGSLSGAPAWRLNRRLRELVLARPELENWSSHEVMRLLYEAFDPRPQSPTLLKVAPGRQASYWDFCLNNGYICVAWGEVGNLAEYGSDSELREALTEYWPKQAGGHVALARRLLAYRDLKPGDRIVANRGLSEVLAVGTVTDAGYSYDEALSPEAPHLVGVSWDTSYAQTLGSPQNGWRQTFGPVSQKLWKQLQARRQAGSTPRGASSADSVRLDVADAPDIAVPPQVRRVIDALEHKGQVILYGPPGTGKTRLALSSALALTGRPGRIDAPAPERQEAVQAMMSPTLRASGRPAVWLCVASRNKSDWCWDDLKKEGSATLWKGRLARNFEQMRPGDLVVGYESAPTMKAVALGRITGIDLSNEDECLSVEWVRTLDGPTWEEFDTDPVLSLSEPKVHRMQGTAFRLTPREAERILGDDEWGDGAGAVQPAVSLVTFHPSYGYEDFVEGFKPAPARAGSGLSLQLTDGVFFNLCTTAAQEPERTFLLIIDEINRGDLPRIFGELITLLEPDKRDLPVVLPVSSRSFSVPPNVRIIGTMNTADRSVGHLDAAIRRRFAFIEVGPDADVISGSVGPLDLAAFFEELNSRIIRFLDADHQLGHAFFLRDGEPLASDTHLAAAFHDDIVPLLEDYTLGSTDLLRHLLGRLVDPQTGRLALIPADELAAALATEFTAQGTVGALDG